MPLFGKRGASLLLALTLLVGTGLATLGAQAATAPLPEGLYAKISTAKGPITLRLYYDKAPLTVTNFVGLAEGTLANVGKEYAGKRFFDGLTFHRVAPDFVIQGGDPQGNGRGGPGYRFPNEISPLLKHDAAGILAMANSGPDTNGSQFYITLAPAAWLDGSYNIFGIVVEGMEVVRRIAQGDRMEKVEIIRVGKAAEAFKADQASFDSRLATLREAAGKKAAADREAVVASIKKLWPDLVLGGDGIWTKTVKPGTGDTPVPGATVSVNYTGKFVDGKIFDQSGAQGRPFEFQVGKGQVIKGWDQVLLSMKKGEKRVVALPPELAYGAAGAGGVIPPNAFLVFEIELVDIK